MATNKTCYKIEKFSEAILKQMPQEQQHFCPKFWERLNNELRFYGDGRYKLFVRACTDNTAIVEYKKVKYYLSIGADNSCSTELM